MGFSAFIALVVASVSFYISQKYLKESERQSAYINLQLLGSEIDSDLNTIYGFANWLQLSSDVENYLTRAEYYYENYPVNYRQLSLSAWEKLNEEYRTNASHELINRIIVSTPDGARYLQLVRSVGSTTPNLAVSIMNSPYFDTLMNAGGYKYVGLIPSPATKSGELIYPIIRPIKAFSSSYTIGWLYAEIPEEVITRHIKNIKLPEDSDIYMTFGGDITYKYEEGRLIADNIPEEAITFRLSDRDISVSIVPSRREFRSRFSNYILLTAAVLLFIFIVGTILSVSLRNTIDRPVNAIIKRLIRVGEGDFSRDTSIEWNNEFGEIGKGINDLSENVDALIKTKLSDERTKQELEYRILQSQINPHFMYNTLNTIKWMATIQGADGISDMSTALSRLLKNISKSKDNLIPLENEISLLDDYFTIMKYRYGGTIELEYEIDDRELLKLSVNRFSLQPIVENAIFHGIEPKGSAGIISVHIFSEDDTLRIDIADNGVGMDESAIKRLMSGESEASSNDFFKDVGVSNVNSRIKFAFGDEYGLSVESKEGEYTIVHFVLPLNDKASVDNEEIKENE